MSIPSHNAAPLSDAPLSTARQAALDWLLSRINFERTPFVPYQSRQLKLDRMRQLLTRLGQPDAGLKIVHVAGTKGKGSTSAMIAAILSAAGYRTGVFSSPHLENIEERFVVDGRPCASDELVALINRIRPEVSVMDEEAAADGDSTGGPTYFEITTALALLHFVERQVDAVVLEVGLGGRLDSTNVCLPMVSVITSISFDHMRQLGNTLGAIAGEKAGIIKPGVPVISGVTDSEPQTVIAEIAREHGCRFIQLGRDFFVNYHPPLEARQGEKEKRRQGEDTADGFSPSPLLPFSSTVSSHYGAIDFTYAIPAQEYELDGAPLHMLGLHQAANAAIALATIAELRHQGWCISSDAMQLGLSRAALPGRVEIRSGDPWVVLDTAHNPASARALVESLSELPKPSRNTLIVSISYDKDVTAVVRELVPHFQRIIVTQYQENPRAVPADKLTSLVRTTVAREGGALRGQTIQTLSPSTSGSAGGARLESAVRPAQSETQRPTDGESSLSVEVLTLPTPREAWQIALETARPGECICIAGSFFLAAELRPYVFGYAAENSAPEMRL